MQAHYRPQSRSNSFHTTKRRLIGHHAGQAPPAWRVSDPALGSASLQAKNKQKAQEQLGSKILLTNLPADVGEKEVEDLFKKTIGPLRDSFLIYDARGVSKGMAIVSFQHTGDAAAARAKYNGKIVDGRRPIRIQIVVDDVPALPGPPRTPSLLDRLGLTSITKNMASGHIEPATTTQPKQLIGQTAWVPRTARAVSTPRQRVRQKKGPRRLRKSLVQLDREMEDYRAAAYAFDFSNNSEDVPGS